MEKSLSERLQEKGEQLREDHDDAVISDVIGEVENLDSKESDVTAEILRTMVAGE